MRHARTYLEQLRLGTRDTLLRSPYVDLVRLEGFARFNLTVLASREGNLDIILLLQSDNVFATLADQRRMVLVSNLEHLSGLFGLI